MRSCGAGGVAGAVQLPRRGLVERVDDERRLAAAGDAGDAGEERRAGSSPVTFFRLLPRAPTILSSRPGGRRGAASGSRTVALAGEILAGQRIRVGGDLGRRPLGDDLAAVHAGAGADVDDVVGGEIASSSCSTTITVLPRSRRRLQRVEQPRVVALVQADRRLVEHVEHAGQARADLRGEPDALALAARQRAGRARQGQIVEPDVAQEDAAGRRSPSGCAGRSRCAWRRASPAGSRPSRSPP